MENQSVPAEGQKLRETTNEAGSAGMACSPSSLTPETDAMAAMRRTTSEWIALAGKLERERNRYKKAYDVAIYNLIGVAGYGHPGVSESTNIVDSPLNAGRVATADENQSNQDQKP